METLNYKQLISKAYEAATKAYAPYSHFTVGAAVLTNSGEVYTGCNVENASYGGTICAERVAMTKAISEGHQKFQAIAVVAGNGEKVSPCGICRQFIVEFGTDILMVFDNCGTPEVVKIDELLPRSFTEKDLK